MRTRFLPSVLGMVVLVSGSAALATPAHADPAPTPAPVEITAPVSTTAFDSLAGAGGGFVSGPAAQKFVATGSGLVSSLTSVHGNGTNGMDAELYADSQVSFSPGDGLTLWAANLYLGTPLSTASAPASDAGSQTNVFSPIVEIEQGSTYWVVFKGRDGQLPSIGGYSGTGPAGSAGYGSSGGNFEPSYTFGISINLDLDIDPIAVTLDPAVPAGAHGWNTGDVTATYTCVAAVDTCPSPAIITTDGMSSPSGTVTLNDESSSFVWFHHVKVDKTPPTITGTAKQTAHGVKVTWTCADATSGVEVCPAPTYVSGIGSDTTATAEAIDVAGNTKTATLTGLLATKHAPTLTIHGVTPNKTYAHGTKVTPTCTARAVLPATLRASVSAPAAATCSGTSVKKNNANGSVKWTYTATAVDPNPLGGKTTKSVSWTIAAKKKRAVATLVVKGLPKTTKNGYAVIDHRKSYDLSFVFKNKNGKVMKGKPTWLHSVKTNKAGTKGKPTKKMNDFAKVKGVWTMEFTPGYHYEGQYRKLGVIAPNGKRYYVVIYVK